MPTGKRRPARKAPNAAKSNRPQSRRGKKPVAAKRVTSATIRTKWTGLRPMFDFWGNELKRYYSLETLQSAVEKALRGRDPFLKASFTQVMGPHPIASIAFELFQEGHHQIILRAVCTNTKKSRASFGLVVAKNHEEHTRVAKAEHENLQKLHDRAPNLVVTPLKGGLLFLPDRHNRRTHDRKIYAYVTRWLTGYHELGIDKDLRLFVNDIPRQRFSIQDSEKIKSRMIETIARSFDPKTGRVMEIPQIASGDFVVTRPGKGAPKTKLIACRRMKLRATPARIIRDIAEASWPWGRETFHLAPTDLTYLMEGLSKALGEEEARSWLADYRRAVAAGRYPEIQTLPLAAIDAV